MDYAHANFQSFPLSHHKFTRLRSQYCSVNSMDLTWAFFLPSALSFYSTVSASWPIGHRWFALSLVIDFKFTNHDFRNFPNFQEFQSNLIRKEKK